MCKILALFSTTRLDEDKSPIILKKDTGTGRQMEREPMRLHWGVATCIAISLVAGCGKSDNPPSPQSNTKGVAEAAPKGDVKTAKVDCPSKFEFPDRSASAPLDDILGIRQGAKLSDAMLFLKCRSGARFVFTEEASGIIKNNYGQQFRQVVTATDGVPRTRPYNWAKAIQSGETGTPDFDFVTEKVMFWSLGLKDKEVVWGIWRTQFYKPGEQPAAGKLAEQLSAKYGQPNSMEEDNRTARLAWIYDSYGRPMSKSNNNQIRQCEGINAWIDGEHQVYGECGLTISAYIFKSSNPLLADNVSVAIIEQGKYLSAVKDFEQTLVAAQAQQRSDEAAKAAKSVPAAKF